MKNIIKNISSKNLFKNVELKNLFINQGKIGGVKKSAIFTKTCGKSLNFGYNKSFNFGYNKLKIYSYTSINNKIGKYSSSSSSIFNKSIDSLNLVNDSNIINFINTNKYRNISLLIGSTYIFNNNILSLKAETKKKDDNDDDDGGYTDKIGVLSQDLKDKVKGNYEKRIREMSNPEKIFEYFASVKINNNKRPPYNMAMTIGDLINCITPYNFTEETGVSTDGVKQSKIFDLIDEDKNGLIDFDEFIFLTTLLSIPQKYLKVAFTLCDLNGDGVVDKSEFESFLEIVGNNAPLFKAQRSTKKIVHNGFFREFFGRKGKKVMSYGQFENFMVQFHKEVIQLEFDALDITNDGFLDAYTYGKSIMGYSNIRNVNLKAKVEELKNDEKTKISFQEFYNFRTVVQQCDEVAEVMKLFSGTNTEFTPTHLKRAVFAVAGIKLSTYHVNLLFGLFDTDDDGTLDYEEFFSVLKGIETHNLQKSRDTGFVRFGKCCVDCFGEFSRN